MNFKEHKQRHIELHKALDELFADFILHHKQFDSFMNIPLKDLTTWSRWQTIKPEDLKTGEEQ